MLNNINNPDIPAATPPPPPAAPCVYLAGGIEKAHDGGAAWRRELTGFLVDRLGHRVHDPTRDEPGLMSEEERQGFRLWKAQDEHWPRFQEVVRRIIHRDLQLILNDTDYIIAYWDESVLGGGGTHGELTLAYWFGIPVYLVLGLPRAEISSWILACATEVFDSFEELKSRFVSTPPPEWNRKNPPPCDFPPPCPHPSPSGDL